MRPRAGLSHAIIWPVTGKKPTGNCPSKRNSGPTHSRKLVRLAKEMGTGEYPLRLGVDPDIGLYCRLCAIRLGILGVPVLSVSANLPTANTSLTIIGQVVLSGGGRFGDSCSSAGHRHLSRQKPEVLRMYDYSPHNSKLEFHSALNRAAALARGPSGCMAGQEGRTLQSGPADPTSGRRCGLGGSARNRSRNRPQLMQEPRKKYAIPPR